MLAFKGNDDIISRPSFRTETAAFHEVATVCGVWALVFFVGVHTMAAMRAVLVPLFWAFFLMMGLVPATEWIEHGLLRIASICRKRDRTSVASDDQAYSQVVRESVADEEDEASCFRSVIETLAVILVAICFIGTVTLFFLMIYISVVHMQQGWSNYQKGAKRVSMSLKHFVERFSDSLPPGVIDNMMNKALNGMESLLSGIVSSFLENVSDTLVEGLMMLLYMIFWLCQPMHVGKSVSTLFRQYIVLKSLASAGYACCVWLLLHFCNIDLAIVFGLITFLFNFVPEVGPFMAMVLPLPIVLFDFRIDSPFLRLGIVLGGNLLLKCVWANILEVKLVESQEDMKMHPVVILFFVAFFGWVWGATGMLLSVPLVAVVKACLHMIPAAYRDPILTMLEGDRKAPERYSRYRANTMP